MRRLNSFFAFATLLLSLAISGCAITTGDDNNARFISSSPDNYSSRVQSVPIYYEGMTIDAPYTQIGLLLAEGNRYARDEMVINYLKVKALHVGADAVINVKRTLSQRNEKSMMDEEDHYYSSINYEGVAIRFTDLDAVPANIKASMNVSNQSAVTEVDHDRESQSAKSGFEIILSIILGIAYIAAKISGA